MAHTKTFAEFARLSEGLVADSDIALLEKVELLIPALGELNILRRRSARLHALQQGKPDQGFAEKAVENAEAVAQKWQDIHSDFTALAPLFDDLPTVETDRMLAWVCQQDNPVHTVCHNFFTENGFLSDEVRWLMDDINRIKGRFFQDILQTCSVEFLLNVMNDGADNPACAGFLAFTEDPDTDAEISDLVIRGRQAGITVSVYPLALTATLLSLFAAAAAGNHGPHGMLWAPYLQEITL